MGGIRRVSGREQGPGEPRKLARKQVCITLPYTLHAEVDREIDKLHDAWVKVERIFPGRGGVQPAQRKKRGTHIATSEIIEWLLADWVDAQQAVERGEKPKKIGAGIRLPPKKLMMKAEKSSLAHSLRSLLLPP